MSPAFSSARFDRGNRADAHDLRVDAGEPVGDEPRHRLQARFLRRCLFHQHDRRGAVVDARGVAGGHAAFLLEHRAQLRHAFQRRVGARMLVRVEHDRAFARLQLDRDDLLLEVAFLDRVDRAAMAFDRELVLLLARDLPLARRCSRR